MAVRSVFEERKRKASVKLLGARRDEYFMHLLEEVLCEITEVVCLGDAAESERIRGRLVGIEAISRLEDLEEMKEPKIVVFFGRALYCSERVS